MNVINRFFGIFINPQQTVKSVAEKPVWIDALIIILIATALFSYLTIPYQSEDTYGLMRDNANLRERLGEERFEQYLEGLRNPSQTSILMRSFIIAPVFIMALFLIQNLFLFGIGRLTSTEGKFSQVFSLFLHGRMIDVVLGGGLKLFLVLTKKSFADITLSPALFLPKLEVTSTPFMILSQIDFFQLWAFGVIGLGLSHILKVDAKKGLLISYGFWFIKFLFNVGIGILGQQFVR